MYRPLSLHFTLCTHIALTEISHIFLPASGASHCRGFPEDPEGGGEEEEERREEERNQERPSHLPLSHRAIALHLGALWRAETWQERTHSQQGVAWLVDSDDSEENESCHHLYKSQVLCWKREEPSMWHKSIKWKWRLVGFWQRPGLLCSHSNL